MLIFATPDDVDAWNTGNVDLSGYDVVGLLRSAAFYIDDAIENAYYDTDPMDNETPTDPVVLQALNDATCAQVLAYVKLGVDPGTGGVVTPSVKSSVGIGSGKIVYADAQAAAAARTQALKGLVPEAQQILRAAGLTPTRVWTYG